MGRPINRSARRVGVTCPKCKTNEYYKKNGLCCACQIARVQNNPARNEITAKTKAKRAADKEQYRLHKISEAARVASEMPVLPPTPRQVNIDFYHAEAPERYWGGDEDID